MKTILVATDFSERSDRALRRATLLARQTGAALTLVHAVDDDQPARLVAAARDAAILQLRDQGATLRDVDGLACETRVTLGAPFEATLRTADEMRPDLLVIGPHRRQALWDVFVGTTAERIIRASRVPVLMVNAPPLVAYRHALFATDLSEGSRQALETLLGLGLIEAVRLSIYHAYHAPALRLAMGHTLGKEGREDYLKEAEKDAARRLADFLGGLDVGRASRVVRLETSTAAAEIVAAAKELAADLVVVSTSGRTGLAKAVLGSVAEEVLRTADRDILAVPPRGAE
ncbi:universal stress protein [Polymorphum gilvum]|uniref:UspA domain protein n=1 Tax=Polymorphum gilvum (strain LMG 25793 / CGMCC 1.9160 / SL003B-26A1) TaxID=991905 RepID=F2J3F9_POLGS|nr:universal stress protein [Polymorphum gilvum]ADZ70984.1 UspA domain protein [Polymorphum gilvum SL003B-26A1]